MKKDKCEKCGGLLGFINNECYCQPSKTIQEIKNMEHSKDQVVYTLNDKVIADFEEIYKTANPDFELQIFKQFILEKVKEAREEVKQELREKTIDIIAKRMVESRTDKEVDFGEDILKQLTKIFTIF